MTTETKLHPINIKNIIVPEPLRPGRLLFDPRERINEKDRDYIRQYLDQRILNSNSLRIHHLGSQIEAAMLVFPDMTSEILQTHKEKLHMMWNEDPWFHALRKVVAPNAFQEGTRYVLNELLKESTYGDGDYKTFLSAANSLTFLFPDIHGRIEVPNHVWEATYDSLLKEREDPLRYSTEFTGIASQVKIALPEHFEKIRHLVEGQEANIKASFDLQHRVIRTSRGAMGEKDYMHRFLLLADHILTLYADSIELTTDGFKVITGDVIRPQNEPLPVARQF